MHLRKSSFTPKVTLSSLGAVAGSISVRADWVYFLSTDKVLHPNKMHCVLAKATDYSHSPLSCTVAR